MDYIKEFAAVVSRDTTDDNWPGLNKEGTYISRIVDREDMICYITRTAESKRFGDHYDYAEWAATNEAVYEEAVDWLNNRSLESACKAWLEKYSLYIDACESYMTEPLNF